LYPFEDSIHVDKRTGVNAKFSSFWLMASDFFGYEYTPSFLFSGFTKVDESVSV
jgi:hypothetical protein